MVVPETLSSNNSTENTPSKSYNIQFKEPSFKLHTFTTEIVDKKVRFQVIKLIDSLIILINLMDKVVLYDLSLGMFNTKRMKEPVATKIMGDFVDDCSKNMALKLSRKLEKSVYVSLNVDSDRLLLPAIEKRLCEEIKNKPDMF